MYIILSNGRFFVNDEDTATIKAIIEYNFGGGKEESLIKLLNTLESMAITKGYSQALAAYQSNVN